MSRFKKSAPDDRDKPNPSCLTRSDVRRIPQVADNLALVLGGGGAAGNAWEIGIIAGLAEAGLDLTEAADW